MLCARSLFLTQLNIWCLHWVPLLKRIYSAKLRWLWNILLASKIWYENNLKLCLYEDISCQDGFQVTQGLSQVNSTEHVTDQCLKTMSQWIALIPLFTQIQFEGFAQTENFNEDCSPDNQSWQKTRRRACLLWNSWILIRISSCQGSVKISDFREPTAGG